MVRPYTSGRAEGLPGTSGIHVQPLVPWRSTLPSDIPSFGLAGQSITAACSVMLAGPALSAFAIFHWSECADVVNVPGGNAAVAEDRSSAKAVVEIATNTIAAQRALLTMRNLLVPDIFCCAAKPFLHIDQSPTATCDQPYVGLAAA